MKNNITVSLSKKLFQISLDWRYRNRLSAFIGSENKFLYNLQMILPEIVVCKAFQYMYTQNIMAQLSTARFTYILNCSGALPCISDVKHIPKSTLARIHNSRAIQTHPINHPLTKTHATILQSFRKCINFQGRRSLHCTKIRLDKCNQYQREYKNILLSKADKYVASLKLNRPKAKNAVGLETTIEFVDGLRVLEEDTSVRCVVLSGEGPDFTSGVDIKSFMSVYAQLQETEDPARKAKLLQGIVKKFQYPFKQMYDFSKPIICVQHGICYGLGMELAACSDIRYCSKDTKMSIKEVLIGIAADVGSLQEMPKLVSNQSLLRELIYTGRDLSSDEALELGFVSRIFETKQDALDGALETAKLISSRSPVAVQGSKRNLRFSENKPFNTGLDYNAIWNMSMMQSSDVVKAITAIMSKTDDVGYDDY